MRALSISYVVRKMILVAATMSFVAVGYAMAFAPIPAFAGTSLDVCDSTDPKQAEVRDSAICKGRSENVGGSFGQNLVNTMLFVLGIVAVAMIIFGGFKYVTANGDASKLSSAKNTILYSVVGLVVAIMAWGIVAFVVNQVK